MFSVALKRMNAIYLKVWSLLTWFTFLYQINAETDEPIWSKMRELFTKNQALTQKSSSILTISSFNIKLETIVIHFYNNYV